MTNLEPGELERIERTPIPPPPRDKWFPVLCILVLLGIGTTIVASVVIYNGVNRDQRADAITECARVLAAVSGTADASRDGDFLAALVIGLGIVDGYDVDDYVRRGLIYSEWQDESARLRENAADLDDPSDCPPPIPRPDVPDLPPVTLPEP